MPKLIISGPEKEKTTLWFDIKNILLKIMFSIEITAFLFLICTVLVLGIIFLCKLITTFGLGVILFLIVATGIFILIKDY